MKKVDFSNAKWIWGKDNKSGNQKLVIRKKFNVETIPYAAEAFVACDTKFWLWVNSTLVVYEGGVFRESINGCGYAEKVDISKYIHKGENVIAALVWFYGNGGRNNTNSGEAGFIFSCDELGIYSGSDFKVLNHPAYVETAAPHPAYLHGGDNTGFDANLDFGDFTANDFDDSQFEDAIIYQNSVWGDCIESPLPLLYVSEEKNVEFDLTETGAVAKLPYAMTLSICFVVEAEGNEIIDVRTDRYCINGGPGDEFNQYNGHRIEYKTVKGRNEFKCLMYLYGEEIIMTFPASVKLIGVSYIESGYNTKPVGSFETENDMFNRLIEKSIRTLYVCMRNNFMDCPDRERGQWIGDVSVQASQVFFIYDDRAKILLKKAITDFIHLRKGDVLVGNVPGENFTELPSQSLVAISEFGLLGEYYTYTEDKEVLEIALEPIVNYLKLWDVDEQGLVVPRDGNWRWFDHLWNVDEAVLENALYVSAAKYAVKIGKILGHHQHDEFLNHRIQVISDSIEKYFWKEDHYASGAFVDDRANAIMMLCGLCPEERYPAIRKVLLSVFNSTPYMERFVLKALCEMRYIKDAYNRMMSRYYNLATNENSTLWEDFYILGTKNHAWTGCPLEIAFKYILGLDTKDGFKTYTINPVPGIFKEIKTTFQVNGDNLDIHLIEKDGKIERRDQ